MRVNRIIVAGLYFWSCLNYAAPFNDQEHAYASLLIKQDVDMIAMAAKHLTRDENKNFELLDLAAEVLVLNVDKVGENTGKGSQAAKLSELIEFFEDAELPRYRTVLKHIFDSSSNKTIKNAAEDALDDLKKKEVEQFIPGSLQMEKIKQQLFERVKTDKVKRTADGFMTTKRKINMSSIFDKLGAPDNVSIGHGLGRGKERTYLVAEYNGLGSIVFRIGKMYKKKPTGPLVAYVKINMVGSVSDKIMAELQDLAFNKPVAELRQAARHMYHNKLNNEMVLDLLAERILYSVEETDISSDDEWTHIDTIAWLCEVIRVSKNSRYRDTMRFLQKNSKESKLRSYAKDALKDFVGENQVQYKTGNKKT